MSLINRIKPKFWNHRDMASVPYKATCQFRRLWYGVILLTSAVALFPLIFLAVIDYKATQHDIESEILLRTSRLVSNTRRTISYFLEERKSALDFVVHDNSFEKCANPDRLDGILSNLKNAFGGFKDIGLIGPLGLQRFYVGPYNLKGKDYSDQEWYQQVVERGEYISDVFLGFRHVPHLIIAIKYTSESGSYCVLRATLDTEQFNDILSHLEMAGQGDAFVINHQGILQTPSRFHGKVFQKISLPIPEYAPRTRVFEWETADGVPLIIGYRYISDTPFILMVTKQKTELMKPWYNTRKELIGFLIISVMFILLVIFGGTTYLVNRIYMADQKLIMTLHNVEYSNKMASIGRLAAGVAHEINNPLAVINEKAGLIKDLLTIKKEYEKNDALAGSIEVIISSVERCGRVTKRLLGFARHMDVSIQSIRLDEMVQEVLEFLHKEAEYRAIAISLHFSDEIPRIETDAGKLQQILLNIINNAFAAMENGGRLDITAEMAGQEMVSITISDDGCGIAEANLKQVFEPFFSTKTVEGGTGLGLSITYGLVRELGGSIDVKSKVNKGTDFTIVLPLTIGKKEEMDT
ncbi:MAG: two-component sensor histidine kinase [Deltaproteobacteria bacterium]|nr:two-component sensor histidine kinase [Deltaproteobacteria bacterium]